MNTTLGMLGSLRCRILQQGTDAPKLAVVLCHGYGAPGDDLVPLAGELASAMPAEIASTVRFVFPEAPLSLADVGFMGEGRAWWPIDIEELLSADRGNPQARRSALVPEEALTARRLLMGALDALARQTGLPYSRFVLGGFSQGAMLATDVTLRLEEAPAALAILSGTLISETDWAKRAPTRRGLKVLQSHGTRDPLLPYANAVALQQLLTASGLDVEFIPFAGEHTIPLEALSRLAKLIAASAAR